MAYSIWFKIGGISFSWKINLIRIWNVDTDKDATQNKYISYTFDSNSRKILTWYFDFLGFSS